MRHLRFDLRLLLVTLPVEGVRLGSGGLEDLLRLTAGLLESLLGIGARLFEETVSGLLGCDQGPSHGGLVDGGGRGRGRHRLRHGLRDCRRGEAGIPLQLGDPGPALGEIFLQPPQCGDDLIEEVVDLVQVVAAQCGGESLLLDVGWC